MIRYLEQEEKGRTKELWKEAFSEDSLSFVDYYYEEKMKEWLGNGKFEKVYESPNVLLNKYDF